MKFIRLGGSDVVVSSIIMGLWQAGKEYWTGIDDGEIQLAIDRALDQGITTFDTAEEYGNGHSERALGRALKGRREKAVILTKVFSNHLKFEQVIAACHQSLKNLETDSIDLYQIHWPSGSWGSDVVPIEETMRALVKLKSEGKIRSVGVSNFSVIQLREALQFGPIASIQSPYSLLWRHIEKELLPFCLKNNLAVLAYSPLAQGLLTGKFRSGHQFDEGDNRKNSKLVESSIYPEVLEVIQKLRIIALRKGVTLSQLSLAWITHHAQTAAISGVRNAMQILENAHAGELELLAAEFREIESVGSSVRERFINDPVPWTWNPLL